MNNDNIPIKRSYHHGNLRPALVAAALKEIAKDGPEGFTLRGVARRAGVSAAAVYRHFEDKDDLLAAVAAECLAQVQETMGAALAKAPPEPLQRFRAEGVAWLRFAVAHPEHFRVMTMPGMLAHATPAQRAAMEQRQADERSLLAAAQARGEISALPIDDVMLTAQATINGLAHLIIGGALGPVDAARATELAMRVTAALGEGFYPREEARTILGAALVDATPPGGVHLGEAIRRRFAKHGGVDLELPADPKVLPPASPFARPPRRPRKRR
ncbi:MAG TPA: TetR/AcrR family transcriptional regulator [Kofleriaceae bacterium]